jgi:hypothetical protein
MGVPPPLDALQKVKLNHKLSFEFDYRVLSE